MNREALDMMSAILGKPAFEPQATRAEAEIIADKAIEDAPKMSARSCITEYDREQLAGLHDVFANREASGLNFDNFCFLWGIANRLEKEELRLRKKIDDLVAYLIKIHLDRYTFRM